MSGDGRGSTKAWHGTCLCVLCQANDLPLSLSSAILHLHHGPTSTHTFMDEAKALLERAERLQAQGVMGAAKLVKKIRAEMRYLESKSADETQPPAEYVQL